MNTKENVLNLNFSYWIFFMKKKSIFILQIWYNKLNFWQRLFFRYFLVDEWDIRIFEVFKAISIAITHTEWNEILK